MSYIDKIFFNVYKNYTDIVNIYFFIEFLISQWYYDDNLFKIIIKKIIVNLFRENSKNIRIYHQTSYDKIYEI